MRRTTGSSIVDVIVAIGMAALVTASIGNLLVAVNRVDRISAHRDQAFAYAREALEIVGAIADDTFACTGASCGCTKLPGYDSCWETCPLDSMPTCTPTVYHLEGSGSSWQVAAGSQALGSGVVFTRSISFTDVTGDEGVKNISATVEWDERGQTKSVTQQTVLSGWRNVTP